MMAELHNLYCSADILRVTTSRDMRLSGHPERLEDMKSAYRILVWTLRTLRRPRSEWDFKWMLKKSIVFVLSSYIPHTSYCMIFNYECKVF
jgi:hypothetical protein